MKPRAFYNDNDPKACAWVRELMAAGLIMEGDVDERSITKIQPEELAGYTRIHLFCGIAGWDLALQLAGWPTDRPVLTNSCPCQPFSCAGAGKGHSDERHLWPEVLRLVRVLRPPVIIGEQVPAAIKHGWLDGVFDGLEDCCYACGALDLPACSVGAPHIRQRIYWLAVAESEQSHGDRDARGGRGEPSDGSNNGGMANTNGGESSDGELQRGGGLVQQPEDEAVGGLEHTAGDGREQRRPTSGERSVERGCGAGGVGDTHEPGPQGRVISGHGSGERVAGQTGLGLDNPTGNGAEHGQLPAKPGSDGPHHGLSRPSSHWDDYELISCADGKARRVESKTQCLVERPAGVVVPGGDPGIEEAQNSGEARVMRLRGYGNSITVPLAAQFIRAVMDLKGGENHAQEAKKEKVRRLLKKDLRSSA